MANRIPSTDVMLWPGCFETRTVYGIKTHVPNRFGHDDEWDATGWIHLEGQRVGVQTAYWGGALIWELAPEE